MRQPTELERMTAERDAWREAAMIVCAPVPDDTPEDAKKRIELRSALATFVSVKMLGYGAEP